MSQLLLTWPLRQKFMSARVVESKHDLMALQPGSDPPMYDCPTTESERVTYGSLLRFHGDRSIPYALVICFG
jgi:hypothetical protein